MSGSQEDCNGTVTQVDQFDTNNGIDGAAGSTGSAKVNLVSFDVDRIYMHFHIKEMALIFIVW